MMLLLFPLDINDIFNVKKQVVFVVFTEATRLFSFFKYDSAKSDCK